MRRIEPLAADLPLLLSNSLPLPRHDVAEPMRICFPDLLQIAVHRVRDVDRERRDAELVDDELRVLEALRTRGPVWHAHADHVFASERFNGEKGRQRRIHAARQTDLSFLEATTPVDFVFQEAHEPAPGQLGIDGEGIRFPKYGVDEGASLCRE